jgi:hypothetical protein
MSDKTKWTEKLNDEEIAFLKRFLLASGSLKELATIYGVSYPTIRLRLDRLIEKIKVWDSLEITDEFEREARALYADGSIDMTVLKRLLATYRKTKGEEQ